MTYHIAQQEDIARIKKELTEEKGKLIQKTFCIVDMRGAGLDTKKGLDYVKAWSALDEQYYPDTMSKLVIVNAPWIVPTLFGVVKRFLDPAVAEKVEIYSDTPK